ncbi:MAG: carboxypeptidase-like regulatory domain-containing protein [Blastocatellia bacterium]
MSRNIGTLLVASVLLFTVPALTTLAQTAATGALTGTITDPTGAVIAGAQIKVTNEVTGEARTASSSASGAYLVALLPPGNYRVEVTQPGFKSSSRVGVAISVTETAKLDVQLAVGAATESITIEDSPAILQTESSALGRVISEKTVVSLPLVTRNYTQIIALSPGITADVTNAAELGRGRGGLSAIFSGGTFVRGPDQRNFDLSLGKRFTVRWPTEISHLEFRAEFFNAFNTTQFANPDPVFTNATFGQISATAVNPRIIQFALKYNF